MTTLSVNDLPQRTLKSAFVNASSLGSNTVLASPGAGYKIKVVSLILVCGAAANSVKFLSAATEITSLFALAGNGGLVLNDNPSGWFSTSNNEALNINLSAAAAVGVNINYYIEQA